MDEQIIWINILEILPKNKYFQLKLSVDVQNGRKTSHFCTFSKYCDFSIIVDVILASISKFVLHGNHFSSFMYFFEMNFIQNWKVLIEMGNSRLISNDIFRKKIGKISVCLNENIFGLFKNILEFLVNTSMNDDSTIKEKYAMRVTWIADEILWTEIRKPVLTSPSIAYYLVLYNLNHFLSPFIYLS